MKATSPEKLKCAACAYIIFEWLQSRSLPFLSFTRKIKKNSYINEVLVIFFNYTLYNFFPSH